MDKTLKGLICLLLLITPQNTTAQKQVQQGIARMITRTAADPIVPVEGVEVVMGNEAFKASDKNGLFSFNVPLNSEKSYSLADVRLPKGSQLILASPSKGKLLFLSKNRLTVTFVTKEDRDAVTKATYARLRHKYNAQAESLRKLRTQLKEIMSSVDAGSKEYAKAVTECDSVQKLLSLYFDEKNRERTMEELERISSDLAVTDYQSLDSLQARTYELKMQGDWPTISALLRELMGGDAASWMQRKTDFKDRTEAELAQSIRLTRAALESYKEQGQNDSVSRYYEILIDVAPLDYATIEEAGMFEWQQRGNRVKALEFLQNALKICQSQESENKANAACIRSEIEEMKKY